MSFFLIVGLRLVYVEGLFFLVVWREDDVVCIVRVFYEYLLDWVVIEL